MSSFKQFATPHCHPSSLDTGSTPKDFAKREVELGSPTITCTDHGSLASAYEIYSIANKNNLIPIIGLEAYFRSDNCPILTKLGIEKTETVPRGMDKVEWKNKNPGGTFFDYSKYFHLTTHFMDYDAYLCAVRLLSKADQRAETHGSERKPLFDWDDIEELASHNVTIGSSCLIGMVQRHLLLHKNTDGADAYFNRLKHLFGDKFYVELFPHKCTHNYVKAIFIDCVTESGPKTLQFYFGKTLKTDDGELRAEELASQYPKKHKTLIAVKNYRKWDDLEEPLTIVDVRKVEGFIQNECSPVWAPEGDVQHGCNKYVWELAQKHKIPVLISDDSHLAYPEDKVVQDVRLAQYGNWKFHTEYFRFSSEDAWNHFKPSLGINKKTFEGWIENSLDWSSRFKDFKFDNQPRLPTKYFTEPSLEALKTLIKKTGRMVNDKEHIQRLKDEIDLIYRNGTIDLVPYFRLCHEVMNFYRRLGMLTAPGRGSAAGLGISNLLGITHTDPLKYDLSMDRFLTKDRIQTGKLPDIDMDLPTREPLVGWDTDVIEFKTDDGKLHKVPSTLKIETNLGLMSVREAFERGAEVIKIL